MYGIYVILETGWKLIAKSMNEDEAWDICDRWINQCNDTFTVKQIKITGE